MSGKMDAKMGAKEDRILASTVIIKIAMAMPAAMPSGPSVTPKPSLTMMMVDSKSVGCRLIDTKILWCRLHAELVFSKGESRATHSRITWVW